MGKNRQAYTKEFKLQVIEYAEAGNNNSAVAKQFKINESMVRKWVKQKELIRSWREGKQANRGKFSRPPDCRFVNGQIVFGVKMEEDSYDPLDDPELYEEGSIEPETFNVLASDPQALKCANEFLGSVSIKNYISDDMLEDPSIRCWMEAGPSAATEEFNPAVLKGVRAIYNKLYKEQANNSTAESDMDVSEERESLEAQQNDYSNWMSAFIYYKSVKIYVNHFVNYFQISFLTKK